MKTCALCGRKVDSEMAKINVAGGSAEVCERCIDRINNSQCVKCGEPYIYGVNGLCLDCAQVEAAKREKRRSEVLMGVDIDSSLIPSGEFTPESFNKWITMGKEIFDPETRARARLTWLKSLARNYGVSDENKVAEAAQVAAQLLDEKYSTLIKRNFRVIIAENPSHVRGKKLLARRGMVYIVDIDE